MEFHLDFPAGADAPPRNGSAAHAGAAEDLDQAREEQLRRLLSRLETGGLDAYEYARRVRALEDATSIPAMVEIVDAPTAEQKLDPVDLALLARRAGENQVNGQRRSPWLAVVAIFFVVLLALGMWLVSHARALDNSGGSGVVVPVVLVVAGT